MSRGWTSPRPPSGSQSIQPRGPRRTNRATWLGRKSMASAPTGSSDRQIPMTNLTPIGPPLDPVDQVSRQANRELLIPNGGNRSEIRPLRPETRAKLVRAIARGRLWLAEMQSGAVANVQDLAARENCSKRHVHMTVSLAFLAPSLVKAAVEGRLPHGIGVARMLELPPGWARQYQILGLAPPASWGDTDPR